MELLSSVKAKNNTYETQRVSVKCLLLESPRSHKLIMYIYLLCPEALGALTRPPKGSVDLGAGSPSAGRSGENRGLDRW